MLITLKNSSLTVTIEDRGAQLTSVKAPDGTEYIWQADPAVWGRHSPNLFPVIGRLHDDRYTLAGKPHTMPMHGFCRDAVFTVSGQTDTAAAFTYTQNEDTLALWPFPFVLTIAYTLEGNALKKTVTVENPGGDTMFYEYGGHDGYNAPLCPGETMADYAIVLEGLTSITPYGMTPEEGMLTPKAAPIPLEKGRIHLKPYHYGLDTLVLDTFSTKRAMLVDQAGRARVTVDFSDFPYLALWTQARDTDTNYVCIEPWTTLPDCTFVGRGLEDKAGICTLAPGGSATHTYTTTFD